MAYFFRSLLAALLVSLVIVLIFHGVSNLVIQPRVGPVLEGNLQDFDLEDCGVGLPDGSFDYDCRKRNEQVLIERMVTSQSLEDASEERHNLDVRRESQIIQLVVGLLGFCVVLLQFRVMKGMLSAYLCVLFALVLVFVWKIPFSVVLGTSFATAILFIIERSKTDIRG